MKNLMHSIVLVKQQRQYDGSSNCIFLCLPKFIEQTMMSGFSKSLLMVGNKLFPREAQSFFNVKRAYASAR